MNWPEIIEKVRRDHNGVFRVDLYFGHDGDNVCVFSDYEKPLARGDSGRSMQEAVERCLAAWRLERSANWNAKHDWDRFSGSLGLDRDEREAG